MPTRRDNAVVLRLSDYSETSQIVTLFTNDAGLVRLIAKGARRSTKTRFAVGLDLLEAGEVRFATPRGGASLGTMLEWVQTDGFLDLRHDLPRIYAALYAAELTIALTEEYDPHARLYDSLLELFRALSGPGELPPDAVVRFQAGILRATGFAPNLRSCNVCNTPRMRGAPAYFSSERGGLICRECEVHLTEKRAVSADLVDYGRERSEASDWFTLLHYHLKHLAGKKLRTSAPIVAVFDRR